MPADRRSTGNPDHPHQTGAGADPRGQIIGGDVVQAKDKPRRPEGGRGRHEKTKSQPPAAPVHQRRRRNPKKRRHEPRPEDRPALPPTDRDPRRKRHRKERDLLPGLPWVPNHLQIHRECLSHPPGTTPPKTKKSLPVPAFVLLKEGKNLARQ